jgi:8-amino-7-oxononanoate synthase
MLQQVITDYLSDCHKRHVYRDRKLTITDGDTLNFSSNDYLSLTDDARIKKAYQRGFERYSTGSGGSMVVSGYHPMHQVLEQQFAEALDVEGCLLFASGYAANLGIMMLLARLKAHVLLDKAVHASVYDGVSLSGVQYTRYQHHHLPNLALKIPQFPELSVLMTESIFSMSGQMSPLDTIHSLLKPYEIEMIVDEAHAIGIMGREGMGSVIEHGLTQKDVPLRVIPFGKAFAAMGALVAGQGIWIEALVQAARSYIYSTALSPALAYGLIETLEVIRGADARRSALQERVQYFRNQVRNSHLTWRDSHSPIQQLQLGCSQKALYFSQQLREQEIICLPMRPPTVSASETGLRVILNYHHESSDIDRLFQCLHRL